MAVDDGIVYEVQKTGQVMGFVTLGRAIKDKEGVWSAPGRWQPPSTPKPEATPTPAVAADARPILHRGGKSDSSSSPSTSASPSSTPSPAPASSPTPTPTPAAAEPIPEDPNRQVLRRGKPTPEQPQTTGAQASVKPFSSPGPGSSGASPTQKPVLPAGTHTLVGVSDNEGSEARSYEFIWKKGEQAEMEAKMRRLALAQLPRENPLSERSLTNVVIRSFDLDLSNDAVMVLTAEILANTPGTKGAPVKSGTRYLTLIARVDFAGTPQKLAVSLTDSTRLDVAPRLELIDAVDADGDGVADLLFREYSFDSKSYVIYGIGRSTVTKMFEGASSPLK